MLYGHEDKVAKVNQAVCLFSLFILRCIINCTSCLQLNRRIIMNDEFGRMAQTSGRYSET
jgi:hypothetical protein